VVLSVLTLLSAVGLMLFYASKTNPDLDFVIDPTGCVFDKGGSSHTNLKYVTEGPAGATLVGESGTSGSASIIALDHDENALVSII
jgi:hypothetical protein